MAHQRDVVDELAEAVDGDADNIFRLRGVRVGRHDRRAREQPRAERQAVGRIEHADELLRLAGHVGDGSRAGEDGATLPFDRQADTRARDVDRPRQHGGGPDGAAPVVDLGLGQEQRILARDAARAHVVAARVRDDLAARIRQHRQLRFGHVPGRIAAHADVTALRHDAPSRGLEEELRTVALVDMGVDPFLARFLEAGLAAAQVRDAGGPDLLRLRRRRELDPAWFDLAPRRPRCAFEHVADLSERTLHQAVQRVGIEVPDPAVAMQGQVRRVAEPDAHQRRTRKLSARRSAHFPPRTPPSTKNALPITKLDSSDARNSAADATSSGLPSSAVSCRLRMAFRPSSGFGYDSRRYFSTNGVWIVPGSSAFTRMPYGA